MSPSRCLHLRWKGYHDDRVVSERVREVFELNLVGYSCNQTCGPVGPDDGPSLPERCGNWRACFEHRATS